MADGSDLFKDYESDFKQLLTSINEKINSGIASKSGESRKTTIREAERYIDEGDEILGQMEMEVLNFSQSTKTKCQARIRTHRADLEKVKKELKLASQKTTSDRDALLGIDDSRNDSAENLDGAYMDQRQRLLSGTERLADSSRRLQDSHRVALETESIGANILNDLHAQRQQIVHTRDTLLEADGYIDRASRTLKGMARRMATNRMITAAIILILVALIVIVVVSKFL